MAQCISCGYVANRTRRQHCWKHKQCYRCHYFGMGGGSVTFIPDHDDFRRI